MDSPIFEQHESITELESAVTRAHEGASEGGVEQSSKEVIRNVVREHTDAIPVDVVPPANDAALPPMDDDDRTTIETVLNIALRDGLPKAVARIRASHDPHLMDLFHDLITDHFYDKLVAAGKIDANA